MTLTYFIVLLFAGISPRLSVYTSSEQACFVMAGSQARVKAVWALTIKPQPSCTGHKMEKDFIECLTLNLEPSLKRGTCEPRREFVFTTTRAEEFHDAAEAVK